MAETLAHATSWLDVAPHKIPVSEVHDAIYEQQVLVEAAWLAFFEKQTEYRGIEGQLKIWIWDKEQRPDLKNKEQRDGELRVWKSDGGDPDHYPQLGIHDCLVLFPILRADLYRLKGVVNLRLFRLDHLTNHFGFCNGLAAAHTTREVRRS